MPTSAHLATQLDNVIGLGAQVVGVLGANRVSILFSNFLTGPPVVVHLLQFYKFSELL